MKKASLSLALKIKHLVKSRLSVLPASSKISIGSYGSFTRSELISHVEKNDGIGKTVTQIEMEYLKSLKKGVFYG
jgi:hypothetical protein